MIKGNYSIVLKTLMDDPKSLEKINAALSEYPLYLPKNAPNYTTIPLREEINQKLLDHYKYREIGFETFGRWLDELRIAMNEIMPYYNQLFNSEDIINAIEDIFGNIDITETYQQTSEGTSENDMSSSMTGKDNNKTNTSSNSSDTSSVNSDTTSHVKDVEVDTPQSQLSITAEGIDDVEYASKIKLNKATSENNTSSSGSSENSSESDSETNREEENTRSDSGKTTGKMSYTNHRKGNQGVNTYAHDMLEFRGLFRNIIQEIITDESIANLFMVVY